MKDSVIGGLAILGFFGVISGIWMYDYRASIVVLGASCMALAAWLGRIGWNADGD